MRSSIEALLEYLVAKALAGKKDILNAIYEYFTENRSPSVLASKYGLSKHQIRGYVQRIVEKAGSVTRAKVLIKYCMRYLERVRPVMKHISENMVRCMLCGDEVPITVAEDHIRKHHGGLVSEYVASIIELMRRDIVEKRSMVTQER